MQLQPIALDPADHQPALDVVGVRITVLASREQTGSHEVTLQEGPEGAGPPPHVHGWDESFYVLSGSVECLVDGKPVRADKGAFLHVPAGTSHGFHFGAGGGSMLEIAGKGANATRLFKGLSEAMGPQGPDMPRFLGVAEANGVKFEMA